MQQYINAFESGKMTWDQLPQQVRSYYRNNFHPSEVVVGMNNGGEVTLEMMERQNYNTGDVVSEIPEWQKPTDVVLPQNLTLKASDFQGGEINPALAASLGATAQYLQQTGGPQYYQGNPLVGFTQDQTAAQQSLRGAATDQQSAIDTQQKYYSDIAQGIDPYGNQLATRTAAATGQPFGGAGTFGGARHARAANQAAADTLAARQGAAVNALGNINYTQPGVTLGSVGQQIQDQAQAQQNENIKAWNFNQQQPLNTLQALTALGQTAQAGQSNQINQATGQSGGGGFNLGSLASAAVPFVLGSVLGGGFNPLSWLTGGNDGGLVGSGGIHRNAGGLIPESMPKVKRRM